jgi:hypothetical protein
MRNLRVSQALLTGTLGTVMLMSLVPAGASSANISHSYHTDTAIRSGSIVSLDPKRTDYVLPANTGNETKLFGVAVESNDSLLAVDPTPGDVQVAVNGNVNTLVSTINGDIDVGDQIAASPFAGVGMKAAEGSRVIGLAQTALNSRTQGVTRDEVTSRGGDKQSIYVGYVRINIAVSNSQESTKLTGLQKVAKSFTGRTIPTARLVVAVIVAILSVLALVTLVYAAIYSSIVSIGRNPLAKYAVFRTLGSVLGMVGAIAVISGLIIFFLLR